LNRTRRGGKTLRNRGAHSDRTRDLEVSADEKTILYNRAANRELHHCLSVGADLNLIEHFRYPIGL
jgi:hypothetical protein